MRKETTRNLLLDIGKRIFLERGYNSAGIESVLQAAGVPKGSFYHYFDSKEDFGLRVLDRFAEEYNSRIDAALNDESRSPLDRLRGYFEEICECLESRQCRSGCLVGNLSQEMADHSEAFRARLEEIFEGWCRRFADGLEQARRAGEISGEIDPVELAEFWLNSWQGAILRAKAKRSTAPLRVFLNVAFGAVLQG